MSAREEDLVGKVCECFVLWGHLKEERQWNCDFTFDGMIRGGDDECIAYHCAKRGAMVVEDICRSCGYSCEDTKRGRQWHCAFMFDAMIRCRDDKCIAYHCVKWEAYGFWRILEALWLHFLFEGPECLWILGALRPQRAVQHLFNQVKDKQVLSTTCSRLPVLFIRCRATASRTWPFTATFLFFPSTARGFSRIVASNPWSATLLPKEYWSCRWQRL